MASMDCRTDYRASPGTVSSLSNGEGFCTVQPLEGPTFTDALWIDHSSCGAESTKKIMSIELAVKRELMYRRKIELLSLQIPSNSKQAHVPSFQDASLHLSFVGVKRKEPSNNQRCLPPQHSRQPRPSYILQPFQKPQLSLTCEICRVPCSSVFNLKQHLKGSKHEAKLKVLEESQKNGENEKTPLWCELCGVPCMNKDCLQQHLTGKKHLAHLQAIEDVRRMREEAEAVKFQLKNLV